nr:disease resistance protein [Tanacetum cinerariifolium]
MHKLIRATALNLLPKERKDRCLVKTSEALQKTNGAKPKRMRVDLWSDKQWISLANNSLDTFPDEPRSSQLSTLFVQKYSKHTKIPDSFFKHMHSLLVLDLYMTEIMTLPSSIYMPSNLKWGKLPHQIEGLTRIRRLLVSFTMSTQDNYDVIFKLSGLEELIIEVDSEAGDWCDKLIEDVVEKVSTLPRLISFQFYLHDRVIDVIQVVDDTVKIYVPTENHLKLYVKYYSGRGQNEVINRILTTVHAFELSNHNDIEHLSGNLIESMGHVQGCLIQSCNSMRAIVQGYQTQGRSLLPNLERLDAKSMPSLKTIWEGHMEKGSLSNLRTLVLCKCPLMTIIFCNVIVQQLQELKYLEVEDCYSVKEIIMCSQDISLNVFPKLSSLVLFKMPSLRKISSRLDWDSLEILKIHDCPKLKDLPFDSNSAMKLRSIEVDADLWEVLHWPDSQVKERLDRPGISYVVRRLSRHISSPCKEHWDVVNRVFKYLKQTMDYGLEYSGDPSILEGYTDASWITDQEDHASTSGWIFTFGGGAVSWGSKKQSCLTDSAMVVEFMALASCCKEAELLRDLLINITL